MKTEREGDSVLRLSELALGRMKLSIPEFPTFPDEADGSPYRTTQRPLYDIPFQQKPEDRPKRTATSPGAIYAEALDFFNEKQNDRNEWRNRPGFSG